MFQGEKKLLEWIQQHISYLFLPAILFVAIKIRLGGLEYTSGDYLGCLLPWYESIAADGGFQALGSLTGNYNVPYQILIAALTYLPIPPLYAFKWLSILFDFLLAGAVASFALCMGEKVNKEKKALSSDALATKASAESEAESKVSESPASESPVLDSTASSRLLQWSLVFGTTLCLPTVVMNSSIWAQCDTIYAFFGVLALLFLYQEKYGRAFLFLGLCIAFKLQGILLLPLFLIVYLLRKNFSLLHLLIVPAVNLVLGLPALLQGLSWEEFWSIYGKQTETYPNMYLNFPSFWVLVGDQYEHMKEMGIWLVIFLLGAGLVLLCKCKNPLRRPADFLGVGIWTVWTCLAFLPGMHERYGILLEMLLVVQLFAAAPGIRSLKINGCFLLHFALFFIIEIIDSVCYGKYLFGNYVEPNHMAIWFLLGYEIYTLYLVRHFAKDGARNKIEL